MTLARNKAVDSIRSQSRRLAEGLGEDAATTLVDPGLDPATEYERHLTRAQVRSVLAELSGQVSETSFRVLYLRWIEGRTVAETAAAVELTPEQVRFRTHRLKRKFRDLFERSADLDVFDSDLGRLGVEERSDSSRNTALHPASNDEKP